MPFITEGKTNLTYILIVVVLAVIVGGGILGYQYLWKAEKETIPPEVKPPEVEAPNEETADWKTHESEEYGFEVKYPENWELVGDVQDETTWSGEVFFLEDEAYIHKVTFLEKEYGLWQADFEIGVLSNPQQLSIKQWRESQLQKSDEKKTQCEKENPDSLCISARDLLRGEKEITFEGQVAYKVSIFSFDHERECIQTARQSYIYSLCYDSENPNDPDFAEHEEITNKILTTFKFIEYETINWKEYTNKAFGYKIKYPEDASIGEGPVGGFNLLEISSPELEILFSQKGYSIWFMMVEGFASEEFFLNFRENVLTEFQPDGSEIILKKDITIDNREGVYAKFTPTKSSTMGENSVFLPFPEGEAVLMIMWIYGTAEGESVKHKGKVEKIYTSLKF